MATPIRTNPAPITLSKETPTSPTKRTALTSPSKSTLSGSPKKSGSITTTTTTSAAEDFSAALDDLLDQLRSKVAAVSEEMLGKMDDMSHRLDKLEESLRFDSGGRDSAEAEGRNSSGPQQ